MKTKKSAASSRPRKLIGKRPRSQALRELGQILTELRREASEKGLDTMSAEEINRAVSSARRAASKSPIS